jgi:hypothetical protein
MNRSQIFLGDRQGKSGILEKVEEMGDSGMYRYFP